MEDVSDLFLSHYVNKMVLKNSEDYDMSKVSHTYYTKVTREKHFAEKECRELSNRVKSGAPWDEDIRLLCETVFAEHIKSNKKMFAYVYEKFKDKSSGMSVGDTARLIKHNCLSKKGATMAQFVTMDLLDLGETFRSVFERDLKRGGEFN